MRFERLVFVDQCSRPGIVMLGWTMSGNGVRRWTIEEVAWLVGFNRTLVAEVCAQHGLKVHGRANEHPWFSWATGNDCGDDNYDLMRSLLCRISKRLPQGTDPLDPP